MVATADVVTARMSGYLIPETAILFRQRTAHLFSVTEAPAQMEILYWEFGHTHIYRAKQVSLARWVDQGEFVFVPAEEVQLSSVVVRGQFRLADNQLLRVVNLHDFSPGEIQFNQATSEPDASRINVVAGREEVGGSN